MWNEEQAAVITSDANFKQVIAAAGSGKTATMIGLLTQAEKDNKISPNRTLIVTFTNKATEEFQTRIRKNNLSDKYHISTFHAFCYRIIKSYHPTYKGETLEILSKKEKEDFSFNFLYPYRFQIGGIPFVILFNRDAWVFKTEYPEIFKEYKNSIINWKLKTNRFEFEDLPEIVFQGLIKNERWTDQIKTLYDSIIVDEFQDTDETQLKILQMLSPPKITIVGDDWQAIYGFRGATPEPFLNFPYYFPGTKQFLLSTNFRSLKGIIDLSSHALKENKSIIKKKITSHRKGEASFQKLIMENPKSDRIKIFLDLKNVFRTDPETIMLVRSNFRRKEWIQIGIEESKVITIHAAKGLEFGTVILDLSAGWNLPESGDDEQLEEERRILYVGISRAKNRLVLIGRKRPKRKSGLEDEFFAYFQHFDSSAKPTLRYRPLW
jgi:DNA helicase-2/ATP-dependent DNA helicase PcrA